jgi:hypothetical protein
MELKLKILKKGDQVLNVFNYDGRIAVAVNRKGGDVSIVLVKMNASGVPELDETLTICQGDNVVESRSGTTVVSTF